MSQKLLGRRTVLSAEKNKGKFTWGDCSLLAPSRSPCGGWGGTSKGNRLKSGAEPGHPAAGSERLWEEVRQRAGWIEFRGGCGRKDVQPRQMLVALFCMLLEGTWVPWWWVRSNIPNKEAPRLGGLRRGGRRLYPSLQMSTSNQTAPSTCEIKNNCSYYNSKQPGTPWIYPRVEEQTVFTLGLFSHPLSTHGSAFWTPRRTWLGGETVSGLPVLKASFPQQVPGHVQLSCFPGWKYHFSCFLFCSGGAHNFPAF